MKIKSPYLCAEVLTPIFLLVLSVLYGLNGLSLSAPVENGALTETFFPTLVMFVSCVSCLTLLIRSIIKIHKAEQVAKAEAREIVIPWKAFVLMAIMALFVLLFDTLGFAVLAPLFVFGFMMIYDDRPQHIVKKIIISLIVAVLVFILYELCFDIRFPEIWS